MKSNFRKMINSSWFKVQPFIPDETVIISVTDFFKNITDTQKLNEFLSIKRRNTPVPSRVDMELIAFSKEISSPIVSNDTDLTFFAEELFEKGLSDKIYDFKKLKIYSN